MRTPPGTLMFTIAGAVTCVACGVIGHIADERVARHADEIIRLRTAVAADGALSSERVSLAQRDRIARVRLRAVLRPVDATARVASFVRDAARIAAAHHAEIAAIVPAISLRPALTNATPSREQSLPATQSASRLESPTRDSFPIAAHPPEDIAFDVTLDGQYADVLSAVRGLAALTLPAAIELTSIARKSPGSPDTAVRGAIRVTLPDIATTDVRE